MRTWRLSLGMCVTATPLVGAVARAWGESPFANVSTRVNRALLDAAIRVAFDSGATIDYRTGDAAGRVFLIVDGLVRISVRSESGREMTVRYAGEGHVIGLPALAAGRSNPSIAVTAIVRTDCLSIPASSLLHLATHDAEVAWSIARAVADTLHDSEQMWGRNTFLPVPARLAFHLLELGTREGSGLVVHATQDEVAHAVGSVREVVARVLRDFEQAGLIRRGPRYIDLLAPEGLHRVAKPDPL